MKLISNYELVKNIDENNLINDLQKIDINSIYDNEIRVMALSTIQSFNILKNRIIEERQNIQSQIMKYQDKEPA
jgi:hypothetical protein